jgi:ATP/maltotriose-dependent transcriptional regulator MalT/DNA-binding SARP family transcriptional activator
MESSSGVPSTLAVKLVAPSLGPAYLRRPRLEALVSEVMSRRLTLLVAGPGFGKSTLAASWAGSCNAVWYSLGAEDRALSTLARGVVDAVRLRVPALPPELAGAYIAGGAPQFESDDIGRAQAFARVLAQGFQDQLSGDLLLVLDDVDEVGPSPATGQFIASLCRQAPPSLHIALSSRTDPPFPIERLRGRGQVLDVGGADLAFSRAEVSELLQQLTEKEDPVTAAAVHRLSDGWPAAVRLAIEAVGALPGPERGGALDHLGHPGGLLYRYLAGEVLANEGEGVRRLISRAARVELVTPELCEALGVPGAAETLHSLARRGLFVEARGLRPGWFSLSALVRETALAELPLGEPEAREVDERAVCWLEENGHQVEALRLCRRRANWAKVADLLERHGSQLVRGGDVAEVIEAVDRLPSALRTSSLEQLAGEAHYVKGDWETALGCYERAGAGTGRMPSALAWRIARIHHFRGDLDRSLDAYEHADEAEGAERDRAMLLAWRATTRWLRGDAAGCRRDATAAFQVATSVGDAEALSCAHTALAMLAALEGDRAANDAHYLRALDYAVQAGDVLQQVRVHTNRGSLHLEQGYYAEAIAETDLALRLADLVGFSSFRALALSNRGIAQYHLGRLEEAICDLEESRQLYERLGSRSAAYPLCELGRVYHDRGDLVLAKAVYEDAVALSQETQDLQALVPALAGLARVLATDEPEKARQLAAQAVGYGRGMDHVEALLAAGWVALVNGRRDDAAKLAGEAGAESRSRRDRAGIAQSLELGALADPGSPVASSALEQAISLWSDLRVPIGAARAALFLGLATGDSTRAGAAEARLVELGIRSFRYLPHYLWAQDVGTQPRERSQPSVAVQVLGHFSVLINGEPLPLAAWQSRKARDLLKILVSRHGRPVPRDELMELLWPEQDPEKLGNRLSVALSTLRAALDPGKCFGAAHFVAADRDAIRLEVGRLSVDVESFLRDAAQGMSRRRTGDPTSTVVLERAESAYVGDMLEENAYDDWAAAAREAARARYLEVARTLAEDAIDRGDGEVAARYLRRVLERDPYDEPTHLALVRVLVTGGRHGEARRCFGAYSARMREIGIEAAPFPE